MAPGVHELGRFKGKVTEIGSSALQKTAAVSSSTQESKDFKVVVTLENPPKSLKPGLSASADIVTAEKKDVLAVPISSLVVREKDNPDPGKKDKTEEEGVYVLENGRAKFYPVSKGIIGGLDIEVASGLKEGQEVIVGPYSALRELKDGVAVKLEADRGGPLADLVLGTGGGSANLPQGLTPGLLLLFAAATSMLMAYTSYLQSRLRKCPLQPPQGRASAMLARG